MVSRPRAEMTRSMTEDQFSQIIDAILNGKYSWACVLILQFAGYNPLQYIPYRTYNRLVKENLQKHRRRLNSNKSIEVDNLPHLHSLQEKDHAIKGGSSLRDFCGFLENCFNQI
jgi:hypothetical protein